MKILQLIQKTQKRGAETFASQLSNHLINAGHEVKMVAVYPGEGDLPFKGEIVSIDASFKNRFWDIPAWKSLSKIIKEYDPDVLQANSGDTLKYAVFSKSLFGWKTPIISRNASEVGRYLNSRVQKNLNSFLYKKVDKIVSVSQASENDILMHFPFLSGKTEVIGVGLENKPNVTGVDLEPQNKKHIVHVGGFSFEKNHPGLIRIFQLVLNAYSDVQLHLIGDGPLKPKIEEVVIKEKLESQVSFYGYVDNPLSYIKSADVLVLPSIIEGLPGVLLEGMYCKTPVVAYDVGGISEIVNDKTGSLIPKNNEDLFAQKLLEVVKDEDKRQIDHAYKMVTSEFMNQKLATKFIDAYRRTL